MRLSWNIMYIFFNFYVSPKRLRVPPGVRVPQFEYHWSKIFLEIELTGMPAALEQS
jgi:hypothetical protein